MGYINIILFNSELVVDFRLADDFPEEQYSQDDCISLVESWLNESGLRDKLTVSESDFSSQAVSVSGSSENLYSALVAISSYVDYIGS